MTEFICTPCRTDHKGCPGGTNCDCQHSTKEDK